MQGNLGGLRFEAPFDTDALLLARMSQRICNQRNILGLVGVFNFFAPFLTVLKNYSQNFCDKIYAHLLNYRESPCYLVSLIYFKNSKDIKI